MYEIISTLKKPEKRRINFHLVIIAAPIMFFGSFVGVQLQMMSPDLMILIGMTVVLTISVIMSIKKFFKKRKAEKLAKETGDYSVIYSFADDDRWYDEELEFEVIAPSINKSIKEPFVESMVEPVEDKRNYIQ
jgi:hypothetical protein